MKIVNIIHAIDTEAAIAWGDFKAAYKIGEQIESLQIKDIKSQLGQMSFEEARAAFPNAALVFVNEYRKALEIKGWDFAPNYHDSGFIMGWNRVKTTL